MTKNNKKAIGIYSTLGAGVGLLVGFIGNNLVMGLIFGFGVGIIVDSIAYANRNSK